MIIIYRCKKCGERCDEYANACYPPVYIIKCPNCGVIKIEQEEIKAEYI